MSDNTVSEKTYNGSREAPSSFDLGLQGKTALVTGGSRGIGAATVRVLRAAGARVVFSYRSAEAAAQALVRECGGEEVCRAVRQELGSFAEGETLIDVAHKVYGAIDILVVNHGVWPPHDQPIQEMPEEQWSSTLGINLHSVFGMVRAASRLMLAKGNGSDGSPAPVQAGEAATDEPGRRTPFAELQRGVRGHIILVASTAAQRGEAFHADYAASKGALLSLTKSLSSELGPRGILCNCIAPGWVRTEMSAGTLSDPMQAAKALSSIPLGRAAEPEEIAGPIAFLCSPWAGFISGEVWNVNGGAVLVG